MNQTVELLELAFVVAVKDYDPALLSPELLKYSGIVPETWEVAQQPMRAKDFARVSYRNGISLTAQTDRIMFAESMLDRPELDAVQIPHLVSRYIETLPKADYRAIGVNLRSFFSLAEENEPQQYLLKTLFKAGSWQQLGSTPVRAGLNLVFTFEQRQLNLRIDEAELQLPEREKMPVILLTGNFGYELAEASVPSRLEFLKQSVDNWREDLATYRQTVEQLLAVEKEMQSVFPASV